MENITIEMLREAQECIKSVVRHTDLVPSRFLSIPGKRNVYFKTECLQHTGSFKLRGAYNRIAKLTEAEKPHGVIAASAGNHAQGVAYAATKSGIPSTIIMPKKAPLAKIKATEAYGADVVLHGSVFDEAYAEAIRIQKETGSVFIHPFNDPHIIAGQGTIGLEILADLPKVDTVVVPIGGGGLAAGIGAAIKQINPTIRVIGVEAENAASMKASIEAGCLTSICSSKTMADGLAVNTPGELTFSLCRQYLDELVTVNEDEIAAAVLTLLEKRKLVAEGAGAAALAALLFDKFDTRGNVVCVVSGGNIDITALHMIAYQGLQKMGRMEMITVSCENKPGQLAALTDVIAEAGAHIISIQENSANWLSGIKDLKVDLILGTFNFDHIAQIRKAVADHGFEVH